MLAILDGTIMDAAQAQIPVTDDGLLRGDGVFEVVRLYDGRPFGLEPHLDRMARSAAAIRLPFDVEVVRADVAAILAQAERADGCLRLVVTRGGRRIGLVEPLKPLPDTIALATITYSPTRLLDGVKSLSYGANMLAIRLAKEAGADEALLVSPHGRVLEGPTTSFVYGLAGRLYTPPLSDRILDSITRRVLFAVDRRRGARHDARRPEHDRGGVPRLVAARGAPRARDRRHAGRGRARAALRRGRRARARAHRGGARHRA